VQASHFFRQILNFVAAETVPPLESQPGVITSLFGFDLPGDGRIDCPRAYALIPDIYGCVSRIQSSIAELPLIFRDADGEVIEPERGNVAGLFESANGEDTGFELKEQIVGDLHISGNCPLYVDFETTKEPQSLWALDPTKIEAKIKGRTIDHWEYDIGGGDTRQIPRQQILPFRMYRPKTGHSAAQIYAGLAPLEVAAMAYRTERNMSVWIDNFYRKGGRLAGFLQGEDLLPAQRDAMKKDLRLQAQGTANAFDPVVLPKALKFMPSGISIEQMRFVETAKLKSEDIFKILRVPPVIMGMKQGGGLSDAGASTDTLLYWTLCIIPLAKKMAATINERFLREPAYQAIYGVGVTCAFDFKGVHALAEALLNLIEAGAKGAGGPVASVNDIRTQVLGWEPSPDPEHDKIRERPTALPGSETGGAGAGGGKEAARAMDGPPSLKLAAARQQLVARQDARLIGQERTMRAGVRRLFSSQEKRVVARLRRHLDPGAAAAETRLAAIDIDDLLQETEGDRALIRQFMRRVARAAGSSELSDLGLRIAFDYRSGAMTAWLVRRSHAMILGTTRTTREALRLSLAEGFKESETHAELVARVREVFSERYANQGETIVRTETVSAYNFGAHEAWRQTDGLVESKEWVTAGDDLVRESHAAANGQVVQLEQAFTVGTSRMMFPGDWEMGAEAGELCNCRCTAAPVLAPDFAAKRANVLTPEKIGATMLLEELFAP